MDTIYKRPNDLLDLALYFLVSEVVYIQSLRPPHQRGSTKQDPADHWALWRPAKYCEKRKLKWYGHVTRSLGLAKPVLQGTVLGGSRRGRQKKRWEDNIREWTGLGLSETELPDWEISQLVIGFDPFAAFFMMQPRKHGRQDWPVTVSFNVVKMNQRFDFRQTSGATFSK